MHIMTLESDASLTEHLRLVDAVNSAATKRDHDNARHELSGFRKALRANGIDPDLAACDLHALPELGEGADPETLRPVCCGVFLDWEPQDGTED